jgi:hypothetical protein
VIPYPARYRSRFCNLTDRGSTFWAKPKMVDTKFPLDT